MRTLKRLLIVAIILITTPILFVVICNRIINTSNSKQIYTDIESIPYNDIGLVLGTSKYTLGGLNQYFTRRIDATADLYFAGKIKHIIVSGDNHVNGYNEPEQMKEALIEKGVPAERITCDYAGLRTLDSMVRLKKIFMTTQATIISQEFHLERALFIGDYYNMNLVGYCAKDATYRTGKLNHYREVFARSKAVLDLYILKTPPRHLGEEIKIQVQ